jgi:ADP-ribose pyrophosphatase
MALTPWKRLNRSVVVKNPWWTYLKDSFQLPSGSTGEYHIVHTNGASMIIPVLDDGRMMLVNQYRYLRDRESLEFPCGGVKDGSTWEETAVQELREEAGFRSADLRIAGEFNPYNGVTDEICRVFIARNLEHVGDAPEETEAFERVLLTPEALDEEIRSGRLWDGMTIAGWTIARPLLAVR